MSLRTFILGSCVSRDTFERLPERFELAGYVARQSLISVGRSVAPDRLPVAELSSAFQRRMMAGDLAGDATARLRGAGPLDLVLWDLADERLGVFAAGGEGWFTRSIEGVAAGFYAGEAPPVDFGTERHFELWQAALSVWLDALSELGVLGRTAFLQVPWARWTTNGEPTPMSAGSSAAKANAAAFRYQRAIMDAAPVAMFRPRCRVLARPDHRWGLAPFHYAEDVYLDLTDQITDFVAHESAAQAPPPSPVG